MLWVLNESTLSRRYVVGTYYAPNFEEVGGAYTSGKFVRACVRPSVCPSVCQSVTLFDA